MLKLALPLAALALAGTAHAQIRPVARTTSLHSYYTRFDPGGNETQTWNETYTDWVSEDRFIPYCREHLTISQSQISVDAMVDGTGIYSPMARTGYEYGSSYSGQFIFDLDTLGSYSLAGAVNANQGSARVSFYDVTRGTLLFSLASQSFSSLPIESSGILQAGRYRLLITGQGLPIQPLGPGDANPSVTLTVIPSPTPLAILALAALPRPHRPHRRRR